MATTPRRTSGERLFVIVITEIFDIPTGLRTRGVVVIDAPQAALTVEFTDMCGAVLATWTATGWSVRQKSRPRLKLANQR